MRSSERALVLPYENFQKPIIELFEIAPKAPKSPVTFIFRILHVVAISPFKTWCFLIFLFSFLSGNCSYQALPHRFLTFVHRIGMLYDRMAVITMVTDLPYEIEVECSQIGPRPPNKILPKTIIMVEKNDPSKSLERRRK